MKTFKTSLLSLFIAASIGAVSTSALAKEEPGGITYKPAEEIDMQVALLSLGVPSFDKMKITYLPADAIDRVVAKVQAAIDGISKGASNEEAAALIKQASDASKEISGGDKMNNARSKATSKLKAATKHAKESALQEAEQELKDAKKDFEALKKLL
jgi:hypothetical protein